MNKTSDEQSEGKGGTAYPALIEQVIVLTGPTASGKSEVAISLAERIGGEIISLDSIAVYRGMDIGTAKPSPLDRDRISHHLIDLVDPTDEFSVVCYLDAAHNKVREILDRGCVPIFVGGTPMFLKGVLRGFSPGPSADWDFRGKVEADLAIHGVDALWTRLEQVDPLAAHRIAKSDTRRMIRALEVAKVSGTPISHQQTQFEYTLDASECNVFSLAWDREELHRRINRRVESMFSLGLIEEVRELISQFGRLSRTASQAVGYREIIEGLREAKPKEQMIEEVAAHTRQLARRQETWFRSFQEIRRITMQDNFDDEDVVGQLTKMITK